MSINKPKFYFFLLLTFGFGFVCGRLFFPSDKKTIRPSEIREGGYQFINPLLDCEADLDSLGISLKNLKSDVESLIEESKNGVTETSVYFRDLKNGPWFGIGEEKEFSPASLLKVPVMIAYLKASEVDPGVLEKKILKDKKPAPGEEAFPEEDYSVKELIEKMIVDSDNEAFRLLVYNRDVKDVKKVHEDLGVSFPSETEGNDFISPQQYSSFFRILYNASYLNRTNSEKSLEILSRAKFKEGLVAGVPGNITVSHKFGSEADNDPVIKQLHDCGIIYHPQHPYLLCIMTKGTHYDDQVSLIREISKLVYQEIDKVE